MQYLLQYRWSRFLQFFRNIFEFIFTFNCHFFQGDISFSTEKLKLHAGGRKCLVMLKTCYQTLCLFFFSPHQFGIFRELNTGTWCKSLIFLSPIGDKSCYLVKFWHTSLRFWFFLSYLITAVVLANQYECICK